MSAGAAGLRVAMLTPCYWPEVRRGTERMVHELSTALVRRGERPAIITSHRGLPSRSVEDGVPVIRVPRPPSGRLDRRRYEEHLTHLPLSWAVLRGGRFDLAHAWFTTDALVAARFAGPSVYSHMGLIDHAGLMHRRRRLDITLRAVRGCDVTVALSRYAADGFRRWLGVETPVINPPVDVETFALGGERFEQPTIVCAAALGEWRKRVDLLVRAFALVRRERRDARLLLDVPRDGARVEEPGVEHVDMSDRAELARLYGAAWVSALPSVNEAFGLVLAEAMACGTPGVGTDEGGIPEVIDRPEVGNVFGGGERELARALLETFELASDRGTREACRSRALELSSERCADAYLELYRELP